ncbi:copper-binding protein [Cupriavidus sp. CV2]|uniref:copper-binding protein n=1 Tax=Cupriavidus ulmosensis TaxID=3065913 RepID=UPI00296B2710|nr:copper-binding protein [Cupriavidus sp. CV2]MDW3687155.1 copper-binding protein [Cupriavidus sp. CV2]
MKRNLMGLAAVCATVAFALPAHAADDMAGMQMKPAASASGSKSAPKSAPKPVEAEVRKVDTANSRVTLKHGPIENLGMSAMTMSFPVKDKASLDNLKEGSKVRATFDKVNGVATVTHIEPE